MYIQVYVHDEQVMVSSHCTSSKCWAPLTVQSGVPRGDGAALCSARRGALAMRAIWNGIQDVHVVVWVDNFYRRRVMRNPVREFVELNCTV